MTVRTAIGKAQMAIRAYSPYAGRWAESNKRQAQQRSEQ